MPLTFDEMMQKMREAPKKGERNPKLSAPGTYLLEIVSTQRKYGYNYSFTKQDQELFFADFKVIESNNTETKAGTLCTWKLRDPSTDGGNELQKFMLAATGVDPAALTGENEKLQTQAILLAFAAMHQSEALTALKQDDNFYVGLRVGCQTQPYKTKGGFDFTIHKFFPVKV